MSEAQGYPPSYQQSVGGYPPPQGSNPNVIVVTQPATTTVIVGGCSICGGHLSDEFTILGIILAICFFPLGIICCFLLMEKRCDNCGATF